MTNFRIIGGGVLTIISGIQLTLLPETAPVGSYIEESAFMFVGLFLMMVD